MFPMMTMHDRRKFPVVTVALVAVNLFIYGWELSLTQSQIDHLFQDYSVVPAQILAAPFALDTLLDLVRCMFFHGSEFHVLGNMHYLFLFGQHVEDRLGSVVFALFYLLAGIVASLAYVSSVPSSTEPVIGASGAIAGILGAYLLLFPTAKVECIIPSLPLALIPFNMPSWAVHLFWFVGQLIAQKTGLDDHIAYMAHIGGFLAGASELWILMYFFPQVSTRIPDVPIGRVKKRKKGILPEWLNFRAASKSKSALRQKRSVRKSSKAT